MAPVFQKIGKRGTMSGVTMELATCMATGLSGGTSMLATRVTAQVVKGTGKTPHVAPKASDAVNVDGLTPRFSAALRGSVTFASRPPGFLPASFPRPPRKRSRRGLDARLCRQGCPRECRTSPAHTAPVKASRQSATAPARA